MNSDWELFEEYLQKYCDGKSSRISDDVVKIDIIEKAFTRGHAIIERIRYSYGNHLPSPHIGLIDDNKLNACAFIYKDRDFIGINAGTILILFDVFCRILSHPKLFPEVGDASGETEPEQFYDRAIDFRNLDQSDFVRPKDQIRLQHAIELTLVAVDFLVTHEYGHLIHGHINLNNQFTGQTNLFELESNPASIIKSIRGLTRQTLEMDADVYGSNIGWRSALATVIFVRDTKFPDTSFYTSNENALYNWMFAISTLFSLFDRNYDVSRLESLDYPPSPVRAFYIMSTVHYNYKPSGYSEYYFADILVKALWASVEAIDKIFFSDVHKVLLTPESVEVERIHATRLTDNWKNVGPLLLPYTRDELSPMNR